MIVQLTIHLLLFHCISCQMQRYFHETVSDLVSLQSVHYYDPPSNSMFQLQRLNKPKEYRIKGKPDILLQPNRKTRKEWSSKKQQLKIRKIVEGSLESTPYIIPDVEDRDTVLSLAEMSFNAYTELGKSGDWYDLGDKWRIVSARLVRFCSFV